MFKRGRHKNLYIFIISQDYNDLPKKTMRASGIIFLLFKPNNFLDVRNIYQDRASIVLVGMESINLLLLT